MVELGFLIREAELILGNKNYLF